MARIPMARARKTEQETAEAVRKTGRIGKYGRRLAIGTAVGAPVVAGGMYVHNRNQRMRTVTSNPHGMYNY